MAWAGAALVLALALAGVLAYRANQERRVVAASVARARQLIRSDTWFGYREAADLLAVRAARLDPIDAGAQRAFAMAMLALDYRDGAAGGEASRLAVAPVRASEVPPEARLAVAALALRDGAAGDAMAELSRAGAEPMASVLAARVALLAGNLPLALEWVEKALAQDEQLPAALALRGDLLRRTGKPVEARAAYAAALAHSASALDVGLAGSPERLAASAPHARAAVGLAKLALSRHTPAEEPKAILARVLSDGGGTPQVERARAALHLAALRGRSGDRAGATAALAAAGLEGALQGWLEKAAGDEEVERGAFRAVESPRALTSASDDDPYLPPAPPPAPTPRPATRAAIRGFKVHPAAPRQRGAAAHGQERRAPKPASSSAKRAPKNRARH